MATTDDYGQGVNIASLADAPNAEALARNLANAIVQRSVMRFTSASQRGATIGTPVEGMATWLQDSKRFDIYDGSQWETPEPRLISTATGATAAAGFTVSSFQGHRQGRVISLDLTMLRTAATIVSNSGNIADTTCAHVVSAWRPTHQDVRSCWDNGFVHGGFSFGTDGAVTLHTASSNIDSGTTLRLHATFIRTA